MLNLYRVHTQFNASAKYQVKQRLRAIVPAGDKHDEYAVALLSFVHASDLLDHVLAVDEITSARERAQTLPDMPMLPSPQFVTFCPSLHLNL